MTGQVDMARAVLAGVRSAMRSTVTRSLAPQKGNWVNNNIWGDQRSEPLPGSANQVVSVLGKNTSLYGPPAVHSVQLARGDDTPAVNSDVRARVTYGCGGIENSFDCDWLHGSQFALVCNSLSVSAVTYAPRSAAPYDASGGSIFLGASVAKGSTFASSPLTYTEPRDTMPNLAVANYPVRDFVRELSLHVNLNSDPATASNVRIQFLDGGGGANAQYDAQVCAGGRRIPIPGQTNIVRITNLSGSDVLTCLQWFLGL